MGEALRPIDSFDANERAVIFERRNGWEQASYETLAAVFNTREAVVRKIVRGERARHVIQKTARQAE